MQTDHEKLVEIIKEARKNKCYVCEYRYDKNGCSLHQIKNRHSCNADLTDDELATAILKEFVRKDGIEIDEEKLVGVVRDIILSDKISIEVTHAIATKIKEILK